MNAASSTKKMHRPSVAARHNYANKATSVHHVHLGSGDRIIRPRAALENIMNMKIKGLTAAAITGLMAISSIVPAQAQILPRDGGSNDRDRVVLTYCQAHPNDRDCRNYRRGNWNDRDYNNFYRRNRGGLDSVSSGLLGFTFGAIVGGAVANQNNNSGGDRVVSGGSYSSHVNACYARYRSYDEETDTFLGFDGRRHRCNL